MPNQINNQNLGVGSTPHFFGHVVKFIFFFLI